MSGYVVTAPLVQAETTSRAFVHLAKGAPVPDNVTAAALEHLISLDYVARAEDVADSGAGEDDGAKATGEPTVAEVLAAVGDDKAKAAAAIEAEKAGKNRSTLLIKLQAVVDAS